MWCQKKKKKKTTAASGTCLRRWVFVALAVATLQCIVNSLSVVMCVFDCVTQKPSALYLDW